MPAEFGGRLVGAQHDRGGVPPDQRTNLVLDHAVTRVSRLVVGRDGVNVGAVGGKRQSGALAPRRLNDSAQQFVDPLDAFKGLDGVQRIKPFTCFGGVAILVQGVTSQHKAVLCHNLNLVVLFCPNVAKRELK